MTQLSGQRVLLTGATGFIGQHLLGRLRMDPSTKLVLISRNQPFRIREGETWLTVALDQLSKNALQEEGVDQVDVVFHLGAFTPKTLGAGDKVDEVYQSNLLGTRALLEALPNVPKKVIVASTLDVYAQAQDGDLLTESSPLSPSTLYGASKLFCEHLVEAFARQHNCGYAILRYGHIYGPGEKAYSKLIPIAIQKFLQKETPVVYGNGSALRDFLFVEDAVEATLRAAVVGVERIEPVNIVSGNSVPIREIVKMLAALCGYTGDITYLLDRPAGRSFQFSRDRMDKLIWVVEPGLARGRIEARSYLFQRVN